jgi:hypothetical protein
MKFLEFLHEGSEIESLTPHRSVVHQFVFFFQFVPGKPDDQGDIAFLRSFPDHLAYVVPFVCAQLPERSAIATPKGAD